MGDRNSYPTLEGWIAMYTERANSHQALARKIATESELHPVGSAERAKCKRLASLYSENASIHKERARDMRKAIECTAAGFAPASMSHVEINRTFSEWLRNLVRAA